MYFGSALDWTHVANVLGKFRQGNLFLWSLQMFLLVCLFCGSVTKRGGGGVQVVAGRGLR